MHTARRHLSIAVLAIVGAAVVTFGVAAPPEHCPEVTADEAYAGATAAAAWLIDNQLPNGQWLYEYDRVEDDASDDYNVVRHAGVMMSLYQAAARDVPGALESADRGLEWAQDNLVERQNWVAMTTSDRVQAGTNALLLAGLAERRIATDDPTHDELMRGLARFLVAQTEPSGALLAYYDLGPDRPRPDTYSIYYTGEAYWALGRIHRLEPDAGWGSTADRMGNYMATVRDDVEDVWPPLADHWSGYGLSETAAFPERPTGEPLTDAELAYTVRQAGLIGQRVRSISQRFGPWGVAVRGTFTPRGGGYGVFGEGLAGLWQATLYDDRLLDERGPIAARATCIVGLALEAQSGPDEAADYADPGKVEGAWFIDDVTRMDDQQHAMSALLLAIPIIDMEPTTNGHPAPPAWLWLVVVIATINPLRAAVAVSRGRDRRDSPVVTLVGALAGATLLVAVGSLSGWLLDLADASLPAVRLAAGGLCLLTAGIDFARPRFAYGGTDGGSPWRRALVPIAIPAIARPGLVVAGLSIVGDHGIVLYAAAAVVAGVVFVGSAALVPTDEDSPGAALVWTMRLISAIAFAGAVYLIAHAVFDI